MIAEVSRLNRGHGLKQSFNGVISEIADPEDFFQDLCLEYCRIASRSDYQSKGISVIWHLARHRIIDFYRRRRRLPEVRQLDDQVDLMDESHTHERLASLNESQAMSTISAKARRILELKVDLRWSDIEIAHEMNMKPDGVRTSIKRSKKKLRDQFQGKEHYYATRNQYNADLR